MSVSLCQKLPVNIFDGRLNVAVANTQRTLQYVLAQNDALM